MGSKLEEGVSAETLDTMYSLMGEMYELIQFLNLSGLVLTECKE